MLYRALLAAVFFVIHIKLLAGPNPDMSSSEFKPNAMLSLEPQLLAEPIPLDGKAEPLWQTGTRFGNFTEYEPTENQMPEVQTEGSVAYDNENLYVLFVCHDPDVSQLRAVYTDRDKIFDDDWVCVTLDPSRDKQAAYQLYVNPRGIQADRLWQSNGTADEKFDLVFQSEARIEPDRWIAELRIPFSSLRFPDQEEQDWRVHFTRQYPRNDLFVYSWMPISKNNNSYMEQAGHLSFNLSQKSESRAFEFLPYVIANQNSLLNDDPASSGFNSWHTDKADTRAGIGVKYGLSSNLTADLTYNPDFSQIESDAGQIDVNTPFALFYDEKRPFFQEGGDVYAVDQNTRGIVLDQYVNLFYTRSINDPRFAGKLSGKSGKVSFGVTSALDQSTVFILPFVGNSVFVPSEEKSWNNILRAKYDLGDNSSVGMFVSDRRIGDKGSNTVASVDSRIRLSEKWTATAIAAFTHTREMNSPDLSLSIPDQTFKVGSRDLTAAFDGETFNGSLWRAKLQYDSKHWFGAFAFQDFSPGFRADNGFMFSNAYRNFESVTGYTFRFDKHPLFATIEPRVNGWRKFDYDGIVIDTGIRPGLNINFHKQISLSMGAFLYNREHLWGKQFDDARNMYVQLVHQMHKNVNGYFYTNFGREINRMGEEGNATNPFEIVPSFSGGFGVTFIPTAKVNNTIDYQSYDMWKEHFREFRIKGQRVIRNTFSYQFSKRFFVRLIGEYNHVFIYSAAIGGMRHYKSYTVDPLLSYKLNAFSVFYLGMHIGGGNNERIFWNDMRRNEQTVYAKLQYLVQI